MPLWYKRLEEGTFKMPKVEPQQRSVQLRASELAMMLDGIDLKSEPHEALRAWKR